MVCIAQDEKRLVIEIDGGVGDEIQVTKYDDGSLYIEIEEPWAGSTETGFGASTSVTLSPDQAIALMKFLNQR